MYSLKDKRTLGVEDHEDVWFLFVDFDLVDVGDVDDALGDFVGVARFLIEPDEQIAFVHDGVEPLLVEFKEVRLFLAQVAFTTDRLGQPDVFYHYVTETHAFGKSFSRNTHRSIHQTSRHLSQHIIDHAFRISSVIIMKLSVNLLLLFTFFLKSAKVNGALLLSITE